MVTALALHLAGAGDDGPSFIAALVAVGTQLGWGPGDVETIAVDPREAPVLQAGRVVVQGSIVKADDATWPYRDSGARPAVGRQDTGIPLLPYHAWANRGPSTMRVWLPVQD